MQGERVSIWSGSTQGNTDFSHVLSLDIGGTFLKAGVVQRDGRLAANPLRVPTPSPATPDAVLVELRSMIAELPSFERVAVGFPGSVRNAKIATAPNLGTEFWCNYPLAETLTAELQRPVQLVNDAVLHGFGCIVGKGSECILTLGTGMGCALFVAGSLFHGLELGQHYAMAGLNYDQLVGKRALEDLGLEEWNRRVAFAVRAVDILTNCDRIVIGGGNAKRVSGYLPDHVSIALETSNFSGGARLWRSLVEGPS